MLSVPTDDDDRPEPTEFFTYWTNSAASRIDRFYVPLQKTATIQWVKVTDPSVESDHQQETTTSAQRVVRTGKSFDVSCPLPHPLSTSVVETLSRNLFQSSELSIRGGREDRAICLNARLSNRPDIAV